MAGVVSSGQDAFLVRQVPDEHGKLDNDDEVDWIRRLETEDGPTFMARCRKLSEEDGARGLAYSNTGSLDLRVATGGATAAYIAKGCPRVLD